MPNLTVSRPVNLRYVYPHLAGPTNWAVALMPLTAEEGSQGVVRQRELCVIGQLLAVEVIAQQKLKGLVQSKYSIAGRSYPNRQ